jgi:hypothetical protein
MPIATFVEQPQTPVRDRGWVTCPHGVTWPADTFVPRPPLPARETFKELVFRNHQRRYPACDCTLDPDS